MSLFICPQCGATFHESANFCHICGYKIPEDAAQPDQEKDSENTGQTTDTEKTNENINMDTFTNINSDEVFNEVKGGNIIMRAINIMFKPKQEWEVVAGEKPRIPMLIMGYALVFSLIPLLTLIINNSFFGRFGLGIYFSFTGTVYGFLHGLLFMIASLITIIVTAVIINAMAPAFKTEKNLGRAMQLTAYSFTPMFFAAVFYLIPFMSFMVQLVGLYGIFLVLLGQPVIMKTPKNTQIGYFFATIGILYGIFYAVFWTSSAILSVFYRAFFGFYAW